VTSLGAGPHPLSLQEGAKQGADAARQQALIRRYLDGELSVEMTLMYWLKSHPDVDALREQLRLFHVRSERSGSRRESDALRALCIGVEDNLDGCRRIERMLRSGIDTDAAAASVEDGIAFCRHLFDWSVQQSSPSSVALYSLGSERILDEATREVVALLRRWRIVGGPRDMLEIGCGIGRFQKALAFDVHTITGIDVSANMIAAARTRCQGIPNVVLRECSGRDLAAFDDASFDAVLAVDSFPYLYQSGMPLVERHFAEVRRVLRPDGDFVILEFSYRNDIAADMADVQRLAAANGFTLRVAGEQPFSLWDGAAFMLSVMPSP
jgi:SAM-dependent methyltransferase